MQQLINQMVEAALFVPGLIALASPSDKIAQPLPESNYVAGIDCNETPTGLKISIGIYVTPEVKAVAIVAALSASIKAIVRRSSFKLTSLTVFIRGVIK